MQEVSEMLGRLLQQLSSSTAQLQAGNVVLRV